MMALGPPGDIISIKLRHIIPADAWILHGDPSKSNGVLYIFDIQSLPHFI